MEVNPSEISSLREACGEFANELAECDILEAPEEICA
jgi:hypothetical protein